LTASREGTDHRRRILEHLERAQAEMPAPAAQASERQLKIPLIGEARRPDAPPAKRRRVKTEKPAQPRLDDT
jgi:hypothetical protein